MSAIEELEAAIAKLTEQREKSTQGPWSAWHPASGRGNSSVDAPSGDPDNPEMSVEGERGDCELIVTLHRTIDAQLAILQEVFDIIVEYPPGSANDVPTVWGTELALARAINGTT